MKLSYTAPALADLKDLAGYLDPRSPHGAHRVRQRIKSLIDRLPDQPFVGERTEDPAIRRPAAAQYPDLIFYEVADTEPIIHAVRHGARDPSTLPRRS